MTCKLTEKYHAEFGTSGKDQMEKDLKIISQLPVEKQELALKLLENISLDTNHPRGETGLVADVCRFYQLNCKQNLD